MKVFSYFLPYLRPYRRRILLALAGTVLFSLLTLTPPLLIRYLMDRIIGESRWSLLIPWAIAFALTPVLAAAVRFINVQSLMRASQRFIADMRLAMYNKVLQLSMRYHGNVSSGAMVSRIMTDVNMLQQILTQGTLQILVDVTVVVFVVFVAFTIEVRLACFLLFVLLLYVVVYRLFARRIRDATTLFRGITDRMAGRLEETVSGVRQVRIYNQEERETEDFLFENQRSLDKFLSQRLSSVGLSTSCGAIAGYGSTISFGLGAYFVISGDMTPGDLLAFNQYLWMAIAPAVHLTTIAGQLTETAVAMRRVIEVLEEPIEITSPPDARPMPPGPGAVTLRDVTFHYVPEQPLYRHLNLEIRPGQTAALVGRTGCGKTTMTAILMRQWDVLGGQVLIDGVDIRTVESNSLRQRFGVVLQDPVIFDGTLAENIAYGLPRAPREAVENAAKAAEVYEMAVALPQGFDTLLGTEGIKLSKGQRQRISIARAILKDPSILIMDEATSALDSESEALIQTALERVLHGRTSIVVAHRLSTITRADLIVVMEAGAIIEQGTHEELMAVEGGRYRKFYDELRLGHGEDE